MITTDEELRRDSYLWTQSRFLQLVLMWPIRTNTRLQSLAVGIYYVFLIVILALCTIGLISKALLTSDLVDRSEAIDIFTLTASALYKLIYLSVRHRRLRAITTFSEERFHEGPLFGEGSLRMADWMKWATPLSKVHVFLGFFCISFWGACPLLKVLFGLTDELTLPMNVWYPIDLRTSTRHFLPLYVLHYIGLIAAVQVYMACDGFFFSLLYLASGQIEIVKVSLGAIKEIRPNGNESMKEAKYNGLKQCVILHNDIIILLKEIDLMLRSMIVADVLHAIIQISFAMLQASESQGIIESLKMVLFVSYCFIHQYLNSLFGQILINQQESLMAEVYGADWTGENESFKRSLHIMMSGSVSPVKFSAWRMYFLQYETFVEFVRTMVSFFMVLRTLQEQGMIEVK